MKVSLCYTGTKNHWYKDMDYLVGDFPFCGYATKMEYDALKSSGGMKLQKNEDRSRYSEEARVRVVDALTRSNKSFYLFQGRIGYGDYLLLVDRYSDMVSEKTGAHEGMYMYMKASENALKGLRVSWDYSGDHFTWTKCSAKTSCSRVNDTDKYHSDCACKVLVPYEFIFSSMLGMQYNRQVSFSAMQHIIDDSIVTLTRIADKAVVYNGALTGAVLA